MVRGVPALLARIDPERAIRDVVEELERGDKPLQTRLEDQDSAPGLQNGVGQGGADAKPAGDGGDDPAVSNSATALTPARHGRPTLIHLSVAQLARQFGRI